MVKGVIKDNFIFAFLSFLHHIHFLCLRQCHRQMLSKVAFLWNNFLQVFGTIFILFLCHVYHYHLLQCNVAIAILSKVCLRTAHMICCSYAAQYRWLDKLSPDVHCASIKSQSFRYFSNYLHSDIADAALAGLLRQGKPPPTITRLEHTVDYNHLDEEWW